MKKLLLLFFLFCSQGLQAEDLYRVEVDKKWGFINNEGDIVIQPQYDGSYYQFAEGLASVRVGRKWGLIDKQNKMVIKPQFSGVYFIKEGRIPVRLGDHPNTQVAYLNLKGDYVMDLSPDLSFSWFKGGHIGVRQNDKWGFRNREGRLSIPYEFDDVTGFSNGLSGVQKGGLAGFINDKGEWVIKLDNARPHAYASFSEGLAPVLDLTVNKYGYIDRTGKWVIKPQFNDALAFQEGLAVVEIGVKAEDGWEDSLKGAINAKGEFVVKPKYSVLWSFEGGMAKAQLNGGVIGFVNSKGEDLLIPDCRSVDPFYKGLAYVTVGSSDHGYSGYIDEEGKWIWRPADHRKRIAAYHGELEKERNKIPSIKVVVNGEMKKDTLSIRSNLEVPISGENAGVLKFTIANHYENKIFLQQEDYNSLYIKLNYRGGGFYFGTNNDTRSSVNTFARQARYQMLYTTHISKKSGERYLCGCCRNDFQLKIDKEHLDSEARGVIRIPVNGYFLISGKPFSEYIELKIKLCKPKKK